jgi:hypothetical protein
LNRYITAVRGSDSYWRKCWLYWVKVKVKQSLVMSRQALGIQEFWFSQITRLSANEYIKFTRSKSHPLLPLKKIFLIFISVTGWVELRVILRPEVICQWKFPKTSSGIQTATFRLVVQCLKYPRYYVINCTREMEISCHFYNQTYITVFTLACHWPLCYCRYLQVLS